MVQSVMDGREPALEKIGDPALRDFALGGVPEQRQSVIAELSAPRLVPARTLGVPTRSRAPKGRSRSGSNPQPLTPHGRLLDDLAGQIAAISPQFVRLNAAEAFVLDVTPNQLRALCALPLVGAVRPNRARRT